tara:strand:+ start:2214 stop:2639 length:426 start_codon:yes stop_codon:yes gene_type:complete
MARYNFIGKTQSDLFPNRGIGLRIPFDGNTGINSTYLTKDAVRANLLNFFLTSRRERIFKPNFGSGLRNLLFEPLTDESKDDIKAFIEDGVDQYFPQIEVKDVSVGFQEDNHVALINFKYSIKDTNITDEITITFTNVSTI